MKRIKKHPLSPLPPPPPSSTNNMAGSDNLLDLFLSLLLILLFFLFSPFVQSNPDSCACENNIGFSLKETLLESFLSSIGTKNSSTCEIQHSECTGCEHKAENQVEESRKDENISRSVYVGLDEIRNKTLQTKKSNAHDVLGKITHRLEPGGKEYNYALASKGAKVLDHNKEAVGAGNILERDEDKYLRNPCSVDGKFVVIELSEETLVDSINIANLEHYSSNFKDFVLLGSLSYPTETWIPLGNFTAENAKHAQRFTLVEPKWVRYMMLNLVSHYGSEFYCTLSFLEVHGVDAIEKMLEDFIVVPDEPAGNRIVSLELEANSSIKEDNVQVIDGAVAHAKVPDAIDEKNDVQKGNAPNHIKEVRQQLAGRIPSDAVLKILMQKLSSLELSFSVLEEYTRELDRRYGGALPELQKEISDKTVLLEKIGSEIKDLLDSNMVLGKEFGELENWKSTVSGQIDDLVKDNAHIRENVEAVLSRQETMENKELVVLILCLFCACIALFKMTRGRILTPLRTCQPSKMSESGRCWLLLFISSGAATLVTLLCC